MENTIVIFDQVGGRVRHVTSQVYGVPVIEDYEVNYLDSTNGSAIFDADTMDYVVGVVNYDIADWDTTSGLLTLDAADKYGITEAEIGKYIRDLDIAMPVGNVKNNVIDSETYAISESLLPVTELERYLEITVDSVSNTEIVGHAFDNTPIFAFNNTGNGRITFLVQKMDANGDPMTDPGDDNRVFIFASGGKIEGPDLLSFNLANGEGTFDLIQPAESKLITIKVIAVDQEDDSVIISGSYQFLINSVQTG